MTTKRYTDWGTWWIGLRTNLIKCIGTTGTSWAGSNILAGSGMPGISNLGLNWKQAVGLFAVHIALETFAYMKANQPAVISEEINTVTTTVTKTQTPAPPIGDDRS